MTIGVTIKTPLQTTPVKMSWSLITLPVEYFRIWSNLFIHHQIQIKHLTSIKNTKFAIIHTGCRSFYSYIIPGVIGCRVHR